jgi:mono/diheme cytochrome c family protein
MSRRQWLAVSVIVWVATIAVVSLPAATGQTPPVDRRDQGWKIPPGAETEKSPLTVNPAVIAAGQKVFTSKCQRCHGKTGKGNGPDSEEKYQKDMDLTVASRADKNPDGVIFYRVWNGRSSPKMPVFSQELSKEQVWAVVAYVQTLREK